MGFTKTILCEGTGKCPTPGKIVKVHCTGYGKDGDLSQKFWSTYDKDPPKPFKFEIGVGKVIRGWDEGVLSMKVGEKARIHCSSDYAYGKKGFKAWGILPDSELVFEIEVLKILKKKVQEE